jgi:hypothetical protein
MDREKYAPLIEELDHLMWKTEKKKEYFLGFFMFWGWFILFYFMAIGMGYLLANNPVAIWLEYTLIFLWFTVVPLIIFILIIKLMERKTENLKTFIEKTKSILYQYEYSKNVTDDIETLLYQSKEIQETLLYVYKYYKKNKESLGATLYPFIKEFEQNTLQALYDIKNDLLYQTEIKKEVIWMAQVLLEKSNMKGISHVSEVQKKRLDAQIQEFEKLEKILVKI